MLTPDDISTYEGIHGSLPEGGIVLIKTGWSQKWTEGAKSYLGYDEKTEGPFDIMKSRLSFPGISGEAARALVIRGVAAVGVDCASIDRGLSTDFIVHKTLLGAGIYGIENISSRINELPPKGSTLFVMPMKIGGGSGAPARVVAMIPK